MPWLATWLLGHYKGIAIIVALGAVFGYVWYLKADVVKHEKHAQLLEKDLQIVKGDLEVAKKAIGNMEKGMELYQSFVNKALDSLKETQQKISQHNKKMQITLDNLAAAAEAAVRIKDAPIISFWMDNVVSVDSELVSVDNGVYHYRLRSPTR